MKWKVFNWHSDINECKVLTEKCVKNAECLNSEGSYSCQCKLGFIGDGYSYCEGNELLLSNEIKFLATRYCGELWVRAAVTSVANYCIFTSLIIFQLQWAQKWSTPADANNKCLNVTCGENAECLNTEGTYSCQCKSGFAGDGYNCADQSYCMLFHVGCRWTHPSVLRSIPLWYKVHSHEWGTEVGVVFIVSWNLTTKQKWMNERCAIVT